MLKLIIENILQFIVHFSPSAPLLQLSFQAFLIKLMSNLVRMLEAIVILFGADVKHQFLIELWMTSNSIFSLGFQQALTLVLKNVTMLKVLFGYFISHNARVKWVNECWSVDPWVIDSSQSVIPLTNTLLNLTKMKLNVKTNA